jgi:hypothetical protein
VPSFLLRHANQIHRIELDKKVTYPISTPAPLTHEDALGGQPLPPLDVYHRARLIHVLPPVVAVVKYLHELLQNFATAKHPQLVRFEG